MQLKLLLLSIVVIVGAMWLVRWLSLPVPQPKPISFSTYTILTSSWEKYKVSFMNEDGRVIDHEHNGITTSEGQSYAMLRAVWIDDKKAFDQVWKWTIENLKRDDDNLFGWKWGQRSDGSYGFLEGGGENSASDADQDIALALLFAAKRWKQESYLESALPILYDIWDKETVLANGKRYLLAGTWAQQENKLTLNPSYFAPYAWRIFARIDKAHPWEELISPAYDILTLSSSHPLNTVRSGQLPPDWVVLDTSTQSYAASDLPQLTSNFSFDAMRVPWRIALDYQWFASPEASRYLTTHFQSIARDFDQNNSLVYAYSHDGQRIGESEHGAMYGTVIGYFMLAKPETARTIYEQKLLSYYSNDSNSIPSDVNYYAQNWIWFGIALYENYLTYFDL